MTVADQWTWHKAALAGEKVTINESKVESGFFYARASKEGGRIPIAIWRMPDGQFSCRVGTKSDHRIETEEQAAKRWVSIAEKCVSREDYKTAYETGTWPDGVATAAPAPTSRTNEITDPFERLQAEIADKMASAEAWLKAHPEAKNKNESDYATNLQRELNTLLKQADAMHGAEKAPLLAATKAVDDKFRFRDKIKTIGASLKSVFERFMVAEERRAREAAQKKFEEERKAAEAERKRIEADRELLMKNDPIAALTSPEPEIPELPLAPAAVKVQSGGGVGRAAGLKSIWTPIIRDKKLALSHYSDHPEILSALEKLIRADTKLHKNLTAIPGVDVIEERKAA